MSNVMILEDDRNISKNIYDELKQMVEVESIVQVFNLKDALGRLYDRDFDLFLVDLELPDGNGHDFIAEIRKTTEYRTTMVAIMTGYRETTADILGSINGQECQMYFQKPLIMREFLLDIKALMKQKIVKKSAERLTIKMKQSDLYFDYDDIIYVETFNKNTIIYTHEDSYNIGRFSLSKLEKKLDDRFIRIHRAFIINRDFVSGLKKSSNLTSVIMGSANQVLPIGVSYKGTAAKSGLI